MSLSARRAWIEIMRMIFLAHLLGSLSARRAWIEIVIYCDHTIYRKRSLSARRAWIEILWNIGFGYIKRVALRKESVDRNVL